VRRQELHFLFTVAEVTAACEAKARQHDAEADADEQEYDSNLKEWRRKVLEAGGDPDRAVRPSSSSKSTIAAKRSKAKEFRRWAAAFKRLHGGRDGGSSGKVALHMDDIEFFGIEA
jgi:hypothetical protein